MDAVKAVTPQGGRSLGVALKAMIANRAFLYLVASQIMVGIATGVLPVWFPMYLVRAYGLSLPSVGAVMGLLNGVVMLAAFAAAGALTSWLLRRGRGDHWTARIPAIACTVGAPLLLATLIVPSLAACVVLGAVFYLMLFASRPGAFTLSIELVAAQDRGLSASIIVIASAVMGAGFGPLIVGLISDALAPSVGEVQALRTAILVTVPPAVLLAGLFFFGAASRMRRAAA
jgi:MFS family permease